MREFLLGPRASGRTYNFVRSLPMPVDDNEILYVVAGSFHIANEIKRIAADLRGRTLSKAIRPVSVEAINTLRGVDPANIFFEHTAYEMANAKQYREICAFEDLQANMWIRA